MKFHLNSNQSSTQTVTLALLGFQSILALFLIDLAQACGPGRAGGRRHPNRYRKYTPLVIRQYFPNTGENTLGASGRPEGAIGRRDRRFKELVQNWNPDIEFRDDERTGADRMMSQRLKEKLSVLAISVMNQWPKVKLRVIEGWDEDYRHSINSLHYEGRAVDITTSDKDKTKYGMLARLAVEAGFDWVHYESRSHVHCSVRSERADDVRNNGCFDSKSLVETPMGQMEMSQLQTHDMVLTMNSLGGLQFSPVLMWLDRAELNMETFVELQTKSGQSIRLTSSHLIYVADEPMPAGEPSTALQSQNLPPPVTNDLNANKSAGNNYYYYDTISGAPVALNTQSVDSAASESDKISTPNTSSAPASAELNDYIYATYARNALIGQYLLITSPDDQVEFESNSTPGHNTEDDRAPTSASRLTFNHLERAHGLDAHQKHSMRGARARRTQTSSVSRSRTRVKFDQIVGVNFTTSQGIYAPLTREGNIVVNSIVASCYAVINDHDLAHLSMAPVRWLSLMYEKIFGLRPETPAYERTVEFLRRRELYERRELSPTLPHNDSRNDSREAPNHQTNNSLDRTTKTARHIHWYPILLYNIARFVLPTAYLY